MRLALIREVFHGVDGLARLAERLAEAAGAGAELAVLPEFPMDPWFPVRRERRETDAEPPGGARAQAQAAAARRAGVALVGGALVVDPASGRRHNETWVFDRAGRRVGTYRKAHLPEEPGFWEASQYDPGDDPPERIEIDGLPIGIQTCSDNQRPMGTHALAAMGARLIVAPRATESATWDRWRLVFRANARTAAVWIATVTRPPEGGTIPTGGPSALFSPEGDVVLETEACLAIVEVADDAIDAARRGYPGSLAVRPDLYRRMWERAK